MSDCLAENGEIETRMRHQRVGTLRTTRMIDLEKSTTTEVFACLRSCAKHRENIEATTNQNTYTVQCNFAKRQVPSSKLSPLSSS
jgi:hypothetical protein